MLNNLELVNERSQLRIPDLGFCFSYRTQVSSPEVVLISYSNQPVKEKNLTCNSCTDGNNFCSS